MPFTPNPLYLIALQWLLRNGGPIVMQRLAKPDAPRPVDDQPRFQGEARLERGGETIQGRLAITGTELRFESAGRRSGWSLDVPLDEIEDVSPTRQRRLGLIPAASNGIKIRSTRGIFRFVVDGADRDRWLREISAATDARLRTRVGESRLR